MNSRRTYAAIFAAVLLSAAMSAPRANAWTVTGATGNKVEVTDVSRIVAIGGAVTEIAYALGFGDRVVAVDVTSLYPAEAKQKPSVGYMRTLSPEGVLALAPKIVLAIEGSGPPDAIEVLSRASVPFVIVPEGHDEAGVLRKIRFVAQALGVPEKGEAMAKQVAADFAALEVIRASINEQRSAVFVLAVGNGTPTVAGDGTAAEGIFKLAGVQNAIKGMHGFKPATPEATLAAAPQAVITMQERSQGLGAEVLFALPAFAGTRAARDQRLVSIPSYYLLFGPRTPQAARDLAASIYPDLSLARLPGRPWTGAEPAAAQ